MGKIKRFFKHIEKFFVRRKQQLIMHHLLYRAGGKELIARYTRDYLPAYEPITGSSPIWTCWWQGKNFAPELIKACWNSWKLHVPLEMEIVVITKDNYSEYIEIPEYVLDKVNNGSISLATLSDIIRHSLLYKYGGMWLDATIYMNDDIPIDVFEYCLLYTSDAADEL